MKIQHQLSNGDWSDTETESINVIIDRILEREVWLAPRLERTPMLNKDQVYEVLATGKKLSHDNEWYCNIRDADAIKPFKPRKVEMVKCSCGHVIPKNLVMSSTHGTTCSECYDRMSD